MKVFKDGTVIPLVLAGAAALAPPISAPARGAPVQAAAPTAPKGRDASPDLITVEAEGAGRDRAAALADALRNAVLQAVGTVVDGRTAVDRERLVEDRVELRSGGIIERYDVVAEGTAGGTHVVRVRAQVSRKPIVDLVGEASASSAAVSGKSLVAKRKSIQAAEADLRQVLVPATKDMLAAPFSVSIGGEAVGNLIGMNLEGYKDGLAVPVILAVDLERWNASAEMLVRRVGALSPPIEEADVTTRTWSIADTAAQREVEALSAKLKDPGQEFPQAILSKAGPAGQWLLRVVGEASSPTIRADLPGRAKGSAFELFLLSSFREVVPGRHSGAREFPLPDMESPSANPAVLGIVWGVKGDRATVTYFRAGQEALRPLASMAAPGARLEFALVGAGGGTVATASCGLGYRAGPGAPPMFLGTGTRRFAGGQPEGVVMLIPGRIASWQAPDGAPAQGRSRSIDGAWFGAPRFDFTDAELEAQERITARCVPASP